MAQSCFAYLFVSLILLIVSGCNFGRIYETSRFSPDSQEVIQYLENIKNRQSAKIISGQFISYADDDFEKRYEAQVIALKRGTGKSVGMLGADYRSHRCKTVKCEGDARDLLNQKLIQHSKKNGIVTISWHAGNPWDGHLYKRDSGEDLNIKFKQLSEDLYSQTPFDRKSRDEWVKQLEKIAEKLNNLNKEKVVVLWRPFHEMNGKWFWWGGQDIEAFQRIWKHMFEYFSGKGLKNLIWVYSPNSKDSENIFPVTKYYMSPNGNEQTLSAFVDVIGIDKYMKKDAISLEINGYEELIKLGKPLGLAEFGPGPPDMKTPARNYNFMMMIEEISKKYPEIVYFQAWHSPWSIIENGKEVLNHDSVITLEKIKN